MKTVLTIIVSIVVSFLIICLIVGSSERIERKECNTWHRMASEYPGFFLTASEAAQCAHYHIDVLKK